MSHYSKQRPESIQEMFGSIADRYDFTNAVLSCQLHRWWNATLIKALQNKNPHSPLLDLCCGTGEIAFTYLRKAKTSQHVFMLDFCEEMLACAQHKASNLSLTQHRLDFIQADAQEIPMPDDSVANISMAYGIRNVKNPALCLAEAYRVLKPGGWIGILELTEPENPFLKMGHRMYTGSILPIVGKWVTSNEQAYSYLCNSIRSFVKPKELEMVMKDAGFQANEIRPLTGGVATLLLGQKI